MPPRPHVNKDSEIAILHSLTRSIVRSRSFIAIMVAVICNLAAFSGTNALACNPPSSGQFNAEFGGGEQQPSYAPQEAKASIDAYNPSPVYKSSSIWIMLANGFNYAQMGWTHDYGLSTNELIFAEWIDSQCPLTSPCTVHNWGTPAGLTNYDVEYACCGSSSYFVFKYTYNGITTLYSSKSHDSGYANWTPNKIENFAEIHDYSPNNSNPNSSPGDHSAGDSVNIVNVYNMQWYDGASWHNANLTYEGLGSGISWDPTYFPSGSSALYQYAVAASGQWWQTYDTRCP